MLGERLFCQIEAFSKQIMISVVISKAGKTFFLVEPYAKVNAKYYCNVPMKKMTHTAKPTLKILNDKKKLRLLEPIQATEELN